MTMKEKVEVSRLLNEILMTVKVGGEVARLLIEILKTLKIEGGGCEITQ